MIAGTGCSQRRAGASRGCAEDYWYFSTRTGDTKLRGALKELSNERWRFGWGPFLLAGVGLIIIRTRVRSGVSQSGMISEPAGNRPP